MQRKHFTLLIVLSALYAIVLLVTPVDHAVLSHYHLTITQLRALDIFIILPLWVIWALAFYGFSIFDNYARIIRRHRDGAGFQAIARGITISAIGSVGVIILAAILSFYTHYHLHATPVQVIINNYATLLVTMVSFAYIYTGAKKLSKLTRRSVSSTGTLTYNICFIGLSTIYACVFTAHLRAQQNVPLTPTSHAAYYMPPWLLIPTFLIPYLVAWYIGGLSVYLLTFYTKHIGGSLYSHALRFLSYGVVFVIGGSVSIQVLTVFTGQVQGLSTAAIIVLLYLLLAIISAGYIPIAIGAKKLAKIESV